MNSFNWTGGHLSAVGEADSHYWGENKPQDLYGYPNIPDPVNSPSETLETLSSDIYRVVNGE